MSNVQLDPNEQIKRTIRRHWSDLATPLLLALGLVAAAVGLWYGTGWYQRLGQTLPAGSLHGVSIGLAVLGTVIGAIGVWVYRHNFVVLTNLHIIEVKQTGLFGQEVSKLGLDHVEDVTGRRVGFWPTILNYGDVLVQTAGEKDEFLIERVPRPQQLAQYCQQIHDDYLRQFGLQSPPEADSSQG